MVAKNPDDPNSYKVRRAKVAGYRDDFTGEEIAQLEGYIKDHLSAAFGYAGTDETARAASA